MRLKICLFSMICLLSSALLHAQDKIIRKSGDVIEAKVKTVGTSTIVYKRYDNPDGPEYTILKNEVTQIKYENGTTDNFDSEEPITESYKKPGRGEGRTKHPREEKDADKKKGNKKHQYKYGDNIISLIPAVSNLSLDGLSNVGVGICYERALDKNGHVGLSLPLTVNSTSATTYNNFIGNYSSNSGVSVSKSYASIQFMPGIKFYPAPNTKKVRYSIGLSVFAIWGSEPYSVYNEDAIYQSYAPADKSYTMYGLMIHNSVNVSATKHFYFAIDLGWGIPVADNRYQTQGFDLPRPFLQTGLKIGYRH